MHKGVVDRVGEKKSIEPFSERAITLIRSIPQGYVAYYGQIAALAGNPTAARQVARLLHAASQKYRLPWHRVVNAKGRISLPKGRGYERQRELLESEGVVFGLYDTIDFDTYLWRPEI